MSNTHQLSDRDAFNVFIRAGQRRNKISWIPTGDKEDTDALNRAIRRASGRDAPESGSEPHPWKSLQSADNRDDGGA